MKIHTHLSQKSRNFLFGFLVLILTFPFQLSSQTQTNEVFEEWTTNRGVQEFFYKNVTVTDSERNVYVAGATLNWQGDYDMMITKYSPKGVELWSDIIAGSGGGHDFATDITLDTQQNVIVCGSISETEPEGNNMLIVKYEPQGIESWRKSYDYNETSEAAAAVCIDAANNIYCTGARQDTTGYSDMLTIKLNASGQPIWEETYDYNSLYDLGVKIGLSGSRVIVTGVGQFNAVTWQAISLSYMQSNGNHTGTAYSGSSSPGIEEVSDLFIDDQENIYVAGSKVDGTTGYDMLLIKLDDDLNIEWTREWDGDGMTDKGIGVRVAPNGDVYLCGTTQTTAQGTDVVLVKYNSDGDLIWAQTYNGEHNGDDESASLEWHDDGYLYITGNSFVVSNLDYLTLKYDSTGTLLWSMDYNSPFNKDDRATNMAIDDEGDIIVSGQCELNDSTTTYYTVKYVERSVEIYDFGENTSLGTNVFIKNNGQVLTDNSMVAHQVKYYANHGHFPKFVRDTGWSLTQSTNHNDSLLSDSILKVDFDFVNPIQDCKVRSFEKQSYFMNYYSPEIDKVERVPTFGKLVYHDVWAKIEIQNASALTGEMLIVAKPNAKLDDIKFDVSGANSLDVDSNGQVLIQTHIHPVFLPAPKAYQFNDGMLEELGWNPQWVVSGTQIRLANFGNFNNQENLIIRLVPLSCLESEIPVAEELCYSSYFGGFGDDWVSSLISSDQEDRIVAGFSGSEAQIYFPLPQLVDPEVGITGSGAYVTRFTSDFEAIYSSILYGTPASGDFSSEIFLCDAKTNGNSIFACGYHDGNILQLGPQVDAPLATQKSAFVAGFNVENGSMFWSTVLGGTGLDVASGLSLDSNGEITVVGTSGSTDGSFPYSFTSHSYNTLQGGQSGFIARFGTDLEMEWCNAFGGTSADGLFCIDHFEDNSFVVAGNTSSDDLYFEEVPNSYQIESLPDNSNYYLAQFSESGAYQWSTYIHGETLGPLYTQYNHHKAIAVSGDEFYFAASIRELSGFDFVEESGSFYFDEPASPEWVSASSNRYAFVKRFDSSNDLVWSTLLDEGGKASEVNHVAVEYNLLVLGGAITTSESSVLQEIPNHYFEDQLPTFTVGNTSTSSDGFISVFDTYQHDLLYGTLIGGFETGSGKKSINGILVSSNEDIFIAGNTKSSYTCNTDYPRSGIPVHQGYGDFYLYNNPGWSNLQNTNQSGFISHFCFETGSPLHVDQHQTMTNEFVKVFPNPTNQGSIHISLNNNQPLEHISIYNLDGRCMLKRSSNERLVTLNTASLNSGLYIVQIMNGNGIFTAKFIVQ